MTMIKNTTYSILQTAWQTSCRLWRAVCAGAILLMLTPLASCEREPELHLFDAGEVEIELPAIDLELDTYWDYELEYGVVYDWRAEWYYGWDERDQEHWGDIGYTTPTRFNLRRYYTGSQTPAHHTSVEKSSINGTYVQNMKFAWGFWDILVWNDIEEMVMSLNFDESTTLDEVTAYTNMSMHASRYHAPRYTRAFYEPEALFSAYQTGIDINRNLDGFEYVPERNAWVKRLPLLLKPVTYIYLTQVILHNNNGKIVNVDGSSIISGMSRSVVLNNGVAGSDAISVYYDVRLKNDCDMEGEKVDIVGGHLLTFGICDQNSISIKKYEDVKDVNDHYMDVTMMFQNGIDSTFTFNVTDQVRKRWKGGVLTVELDMDTIPVPKRSGGSAFDAVVKDYEDGGTHEFDM